MTPDQVKAINLVKVERDYYKEYSDSLIIALDVQGATLVSCKELSKHLLETQEIEGKLTKAQKDFIKQLREDFKEQGIKLQKVLKINFGLWIYSGLATLILIVILL